MPDGTNPDWLKKELIRKLILAKIGVPRRNRDLIDEAIELSTILIKLLEKQNGQVDIDKGQSA